MLFRSGQCNSGTRFEEQCPSQQCREATCAVGPAGEPTCNYVPATNGSPCDDNNQCTLEDQCSNGQCVSANDLVCPERACYEASCGANTGCTYLLDQSNTDPCRPDDDTNLCNIYSCTDDGECRKDPKICFDGIPCTLDQCNPATGLCEYPINEGASCSDSNLCTENDICISNEANEPECRGTPKDCSDNNQCTDSSCNPTNGQCETRPEPDGTDCNDNNPCSTETCSDGECVSNCETGKFANSGVCEACAQSCQNCDGPTAKIGRAHV